MPVNKAPKLPVNRQSNHPMQALAEYLQQENKRYLLVAESAGRREVLLDLLADTAINFKLQESWFLFSILNTFIKTEIKHGPTIYGE